MKKVFTVLSMAIVVIACGFGWSHFSVIKNLEFNFGRERETENGEDEARDASGMADFLSRMRNNQVTGTIDLADYYQAQADAKKFAAAGIRGGFNMHWQSMGPDNQGGRTRALLIDKNDPNHLLAGGVSGGLWVSKNAGASWDTIPGASQFSSLTVSCITQAGNGRIYFGTGEFFGYFTSANITGATGFPGNGIWASTDNGVSFKNIKAPAYPGGINSNAAFSFITAMSADPTNNDRVYVSVYGSNKVKALQVISLTAGGKDTVADAPGTGFLNAVGTDVAVAPNGVVHAVVGTKYYRMNDFSSGFSAVSSNLPSAGIDRMVVAVSPQDANYVYIMESANVPNLGSVIKGLWKSTDGGVTFSQLAGQSIANSPIWMPVTQGTYALTLAVSPIDKNMVIFGGLDVYRYTDAGGAEKISNWEFPFISTEFVHADIHSFEFVPNSNAMYVTSDGGINYTNNIAASNVVWAVKNNQYVTTQCYDVCAKNYTGEILTGMQDNGNWYIDFHGNTPRWGTEIKGGDGGKVGVSTINPNILFAEYTYGAVARSSNNGTSFAGFYDNNIDCNLNTGTIPPSCNPDGLPDDGAPFVTQYKLWENPTDPNPETQAKFALGTNSNVWMTQDALNLVTTPVWFKLTKAKLNGRVSCISFSPDGKTIFAGTESGGLYRIDGLDTVLSYTVDSATKKASFSPDSFHIVTTLIKNFGANRYVTDIDVDYADKNHVVVTLGNYSNLDYIWQSKDAVSSATPSFTNITGSGYPKMPAYCTLIDKRDPNYIIVGTEIGVYSTTDQGAHWSIESNGMPNVPVFRFYRHIFNSYDNVIEAATYGRGIYRDTTREFFTTVGVKNVAAHNGVDNLNVYPNPSSSTITLSTDIPEFTDAQVTIYSLQGKMAKTQVIRQVTPGYRNLELNISDLSAGTYLVSVKGKNLNKVSKFIVIK